MRTITKKEKKIPKQSHKKHHLDESKKELTPWQEAHQRYLEEKRLLDELMAKQEKINDEDDQEEIFKVSDSIEEDSAQISPMLENKKSSFSDRLPKMKDYRQKKLYRRLSLIVGVLAIPLVFCFYYISPLGQLAKVTVSGNHEVNQQKIIQQAKFQIGEPLWEQYFNRSINEKRVKKVSPWIKDVKVSITHLNHFNIQIKEYPEVAYLLKDNHYYTILENGQVLEQSTDQPQSGYPILEGFQNQKIILQTLKAYNRLSEEIKQSISQIKYTPRNDNHDLLTLTMNDGNQVLINRDQMAERMPYYAQVAADLKTPGIIDMEVGIFAYPYPSSTENTTDSTTTSTTSEQTE